jgi:hypothetical protein
MPRAQAILVLAALLAMPLALLARTTSAGMTCGCMCSLVYKSVRSQSGHKHARAMCGHCPSDNQCAMKAPRHAPDFGLNTLMAPTQSSSQMALRAPDVSVLDFEPFRQSLPAGVLPAPFEPPRT